MKYSAVFVKEIKVDNKKKRMQFSFYNKLSGEYRVVLINKTTASEYEINKDSLTWKDDSLFLSLESFHHDCRGENKWDAYLVKGDIYYRLEDIKNRTRKRYQAGKKVKPYEQEKGTYQATKRVSDFVSFHDSEEVVLARYTRDWQLMFQTVPLRQAYTNRYYLKMNKLEISEGMLLLEIGEANFGFYIEHINMTLRGTNQVYCLEKIKEQVYGISLDSVSWEPFFWDFTASATRNGNCFDLKLRNYKRGFHGRVREKMGEFFLFSSYTQNDNIILHYRPYSEYDQDLYRRREKRAVFIYRLLKPFWDSRGIVLMYEKFCKCAQDNAFYMFCYYMNKGGRDRRRTYYLMDSREMDASHLAPYQSHVIEFMSLKHMIYLQAAKLLVATDTMKHAYQWRCENSSIYDKLLKKHNVFLQHGVLALKRVEYIYNKNGGNKTDLFISSSPMEQKIITDNFRYSKKEVPVTGLARWDVLQDKSKDKIILVMPTWRNWIIEVSKEQFIETDYYKYYMHLLNSTVLENMLEEHETKLVFCMHPKFREFIGDFKTAGNHIELFDYDDKPINEMVMEASMMITDYSSVSWDMYYQEKPILFYQFDYEMYMEQQGSYIDMETELYGDRAITEEELLQYIRDYLDNGLKEKKKYADLRTTYLPCRDGLHCKRIDEAIKNHAFTRLKAISQKILHN